MFSLFALAVSAATMPADLQKLLDQTSDRPAREIQAAGLAGIRPNEGLASVLTSLRSQGYTVDRDCTDCRGYDAMQIRKAMMAKKEGVPFTEAPAAALRVVAVKPGSRVTVQLRAMLKEPVVEAVSEVASPDGQGFVAEIRRTAARMGGLYGMEGSAAVWGSGRKPCTPDGGEFCFRVRMVDGGVERSFTDGGRAREAQSRLILATMPNNGAMASFLGRGGIPPELIAPSGGSASIHTGPDGTKAVRITAPKPGASAKR